MDWKLVDSYKSNGSHTCDLPNPEENVLKGIFFQKHKNMRLKNFWVIHTMSIIDVGKYNFCFVSLSISPIYTLSTNAKFLSFSNSYMFIILFLGKRIYWLLKDYQAKPRRNPSSKGSKKAALGMNAVLSKWKRCRIMSLALYWLFLLRKVL